MRPGPHPGTGPAAGRERCPSTEALSRFSDGDVGPAEAAGIADHLDGCPACREDLAAVRGLVARLRDLESAAPPPELFDRVMVHAESRRRRFAAWAGAGALCAALAAVALGVMLPSRSTGSRKATGPAPSLRVRAEEEFATAEKHYRNASDLLRRLVDREKPLWPVTRIEAFEADMRALNDAIEQSRRMAVQTPADPVVKDCLFTSYRTQIEYLRNVLTPADPSR
jgi:hypothetical protein